MELGELVFEELQLRHHGTDKQIKGRIVAAGSHASLCRFSERFGFLCAEPSATRAVAGKVGR